MKTISTICLLLTIFCTLKPANQAYEHAHIDLKNYFENQLTQEQRIKNHRTSILTQAAQKLEKGVNRVELKEVRLSLETELQPSPENEQIIARIKTIKESHARTFPFCCKPWIFQRTITREAQSLHATIDGVLKKENPDLYNSVKTNTTTPLSDTFTTAYPVISPLSAPLLTSALSQCGRNK